MEPSREALTNVWFVERLACLPQEVADNIYSVGAESVTERIGVDQRLEVQGALTNDRHRRWRPGHDDGRHAVPDDPEPLVTGLEDSYNGLAIHLPNPYLPTGHTRIVPLRCFQLLPE